MKRCNSVSCAITRLGVAAALALALVACAGSGPDATTLQIEQADRSFGLGPSGSAAEARSLPDTWSYLDRKHHRSARYVARFEVAELPAEPWSVYLARADMNAEVFVNGVSLGAIGNLEAPISRMRHYPILRPVPADVLRVGENELEVQLHVEPTSGGALSTIEVGPTRVLEPRAELRHFFQITWLQITVFAAILLIVVVATVYGPRGQANAYRWFQFSVALWIVYACEIWIRDAPYAPQLWEATANGAQYLSIWAIMLGFHRALDGPRPVIERRVLFVLLGAIALLAFLPAHFVWLARAAIGIVLCVIASYMVEFVKGSTARQEWVLKKHHVLGGIFGVVAGIHDIASAPFGWPFSGYWLAQHTGALAIFLTLAAILNHLIVSIRETDSLGRDLESRVAAHERELADRFARIRGIEATQLLETERARLTRGLHEGVGSVLMSTIASVEAESRERPRARSEVAGRIRDALDDLRLVIDSLRPEEALLDILARLRSRLSARYERRAIEIEWRVDDVPPLRGLEAEHALVLLRILQDAFRRVERIPGVRTVTVRTGCEDRAAMAGLYVDIEDDGNDTGPLREPPAMHERARAIGGAVSVERMQRQTRIRLWLPLELPEVSRA